MRLSLIIGAVVVLGAAITTGLTLNSFNEFKRLAEAPATICKPVIGVAGPEDMEFDPVTGLTFVSSYDRQAAAKGEKPRGEILGFALGESLEDALIDSNWRDRSAGLPENFVPAGLSLFEAGDVHSLFVINEADNSVLRYAIGTTGDLKLLETFADPRLTSLNDVVAVGPRQFYVTSDSRSPRESLFGKIEFLLGSTTGQVFYFDGNSWGVAASDMQFPNGLAASKDGKHLLVAETRAKKIRIFNRDSTSGVLSETQSIELEGFPDNFSWRDDGYLMIGVHPKPLALSRHVNHPESHKAPSQILELRLDSDGKAMSEPVVLYQNEGEQLSGATVAVRDHDKTVIGALMENKILLCN